MNEDELYNRIIAKYPAYSGIQKSDLMPKIYAKYPQYQQVVESPTVVPELVAGRFEKKDLAKKIIPQFTKGLYESVPFGRQAVSNLPNADFIQQVQEGVPSPEGALPFLARMGGEIAGSTPLMNIGGGLTKLPNLARLAIGGAAYSGAKSFGEGNNTLDIAKDAAMGAAATYAMGKGAEIAGKGIIKGAELASKGLGKAPGAVINSLIKPLLKDFSYGKNPGRAVASEGIVANNLDELATKIGQRRQEIGKEIRVKLIQNSKQRVDLRQALKPLDDAIAEANKSPRSNKALIERLNNLKLDLLEAQTDELGNITSQRNLIDLTPEEAFNFKSQVGDLTKFTGNPSDDQLVNKPMKKIYGIVKERLNQAVPGLRARNERYADLTSAEIAAKYRDKINSRQAIVGPLSAKILGGGAILTGLASGNPELIALGLAEFGSEKLLKSTAFKTRLASGLSKVGEADFNKFITQYPELKKIPEVVARISAIRSTNGEGQKAQ